MKKALEKKKLTSEEARNAERLAMQAFHENNALVEVSCIRTVELFLTHGV